MSIDSDQINPVRKHKRDVRLRILAPVILPALLLVALCVVLVVSVAADGLSFRQVTVAMGMLFASFLALPLIILCLVPYLLFAASAAGLGLLTGKARKPIRAARQLTGTVATKTHQVAPRVARPLLGLNVRMARWEGILNAWLAPALSPGKEKDDD